MASFFLLSFYDSRIVDINSFALLVAPNFVLKG